MSHHPRSLAARIAARAGWPVLAAGLTARRRIRPTPAGTGLVISEVYGGGGNTGAIYNARLRRALQPDRRGHQPVAASRSQYRASRDRHRRDQRRRPDGHLPAGRPLPRPDERPPAPAAYRAADARRRPAADQPWRHRRPGPARQHDDDPTPVTADRRPRRRRRPVDRPGRVSAPTPPRYEGRAATGRARRPTAAVGRSATAAPTPTTTPTDFTARRPDPRRRGGRPARPPRADGVRRHDRRDPGHRRATSPAAPATPCTTTGVVTAATRPAASTASTSRPAAPAARSTPPPAPPTRSSSSAARRRSPTDPAHRRLRRGHRHRSREFAAA